MTKLISKALLACAIFFGTFAQAMLNIQITHGIDSALPIAVLPFNESNVSSGTENIPEVIRNDLSNSGLFNTIAVHADDLSIPVQEYSSIFKTRGADNVVRGFIKRVGSDKYSVRFELYDVFKSSKNGAEVQYQNTSNLLMSKSFDNIPASRLRALAHHISDLIYTELTGIRGYFSTRIAYVIVNNQNDYNNRRYTLEVADQDGFNPKPLVISKEPIMSPNWSPDGKELAYVSFENKRAEIFSIRVATGQRQKLTSFEGINGAPSWSPDGRKMAVVLSKDGSPNLYLMDIAARQLTRLTAGPYIDTEPTWSPDGSAIYFTSSRGSTPQIYRVSPYGGGAQRVTFNGAYNARPQVTPDGKQLVMLHRDETGAYRIATQDLATGYLRLLSNARLDESPSLSPNGTMILYGTQVSGKRVLGAVSLDGRVQLRLPSRDGSVQEPAWSPFLS